MCFYHHMVSNSTTVSDVGGQEGWAQATSLPSAHRTVPRPYRTNFR